MSSALFTTVTTTLKGDNYNTWASEMEAFLQATGLESAITTDQPSEPSPLIVANTASVEAWKNYEVAFKAWKEIDTKAIGNIRLRISPSIRILAKENSDTAKKLSKYLAKTYNFKSLGAVFNDFAAAMAIKIPYKQNSLSSIMKIGMHFTHMAEADIGVGQIWTLDQSRQYESGQNRNIPALSFLQYAEGTYYIKSFLQYAEVDLFDRLYALQLLI
ncbi:MAG: hypothetical protein NXY57DRAFT_968302 [Lentinula lateritia]|nr:MAG: hypothetical protein NXY57DRAFT_968302 [Lentinula lateritia]